jgi:hypothetical protein
MIKCDIIIDNIVCSVKVVFMAHIFISYRRADSRLVANRIYDRLVQAFGKKDIFKDIDNIPLGKDFRGVLREATAACQIMLVIIGPEWLDIQDSATGRRRLDDPDDFVRLEVQTGLERDMLVIPVLVEKATMPSALQLPDALRELAYKNASIINDDPHFHHDMNRLIAYMREHLIGQNPRLIDWRWIVGIISILLIAALITILPHLMSADQPIPTPPATSVIAQQSTEIPTLSRFQQLQTTEAELTQSAGTQAALELILTDQFISDSNATATAAEFFATETVAFATLLALSDTPTPLRPTDIPTSPATNTLQPILLTSPTLISQQTLSPLPTSTPRPSATLQPQTKYAVQNAIIRSDPRLNATVVGSVEAGRSVIIIGEIQGDRFSESTTWYHVQHRNPMTGVVHTGYTHSSLLSNTRPNIQQIAATTVVSTQIPISSSISNNNIPTEILGGKWKFVFISVENFENSCPNDFFAQFSTPTYGASDFDTMMPSIYQDTSSFSRAGTWFHGSIPNYETNSSGFIILSDTSRIPIRSVNRLRFTSSTTATQTRRNMYDNGCIIIFNYNGSLVN